MELQGAQIILGSLGGCAILIFTLSMFFCCVQRWLSLWQYQKLHHHSTESSCYRDTEVVQFEVTKPTLIYCTKEMVKPCVDDFLQDEELLEKGYVYHYRFSQSKKYFDHEKQ